MSILEQLEDMVAIKLQGAKVFDEGRLEKEVRVIAGVLDPTDSITDAEILRVCRRLEERFSVTMPLGSCIDTEEYRPWLHEVRGSIDWYYWKRYQRYLLKENFPDQVVTQMDIVTDRIVDHLGNPSVEGAWKRKGLVVGDVQSGKTANYSAVVCKAADAGYRVIIVLAGMLNALRNQTQVRLDEGFVGRESSPSAQAGAAARIFGVGEFDRSRSPVSFTTQEKDFHRSAANQIGTGISQLNEPVLLVLKKNKSVLKNLVDWLKQNNLDLHEFPMLLIDDEADHASVNTAKDNSEATAINAGIRELLGLFQKNCYLGYTATPFANIFIDPESEAAMIGDDLFPRDFILTIDAPSNYCGARRIFSDQADLSILRDIFDNEDTLPLQHKKDQLPDALPPSLYAAIRTFVLAHAIRIARGQGKKHHSMMINVSRFTDIQTRVKEIVHRYLEDLRSAIFTHYKLPLTQARGNAQMRDLIATWEAEYAGAEVSWKVIQDLLKDAVSPISVIEVNSASSSEPLDYSKKKWPHGRKVIAVGGLSLSRGITLEHLTVSYFLRNSQMYDTLLQMGRWFGYRPGYEDICRIWITEEAKSWYAHVADALTELRDEFVRMDRQRLTPADFGLCVRSHPESLIVTARNKMRTGEKISRQISLEGRVVESAVLLASPQLREENRRVLKNLLDELLDLEQTGPCRREKLTRPLEGSIYWQKVPTSVIESFVQDFSNHPGCQLTEPRPLCDYLKLLSRDGVSSCDVVLISPAKSESMLDPWKYKGLYVRQQQRTIAAPTSMRGIDTIVFNRRRVASKGHEMAGLPPSVIANAREKAGDAKNLPDRIYRPFRKRPLLMLHLVDCKVPGGGSIDKEGVVAFGLSFPGEAGAGRPKHLVEYVVNTVWWKENYGEVLEEEDASDEE